MIAHILFLASGFGLGVLGSIIYVALRQGPLPPATARAIRRAQRRNRAELRASLNRP